MKDVHTEHCCLRHGCKYGNDDICTVVTKKELQSFLCESCNYEGIIDLSIKMNTHNIKIKHIEYDGSIVCDKCQFLYNLDGTWMCELFGLSLDTTADEESKHPEILEDCETIVSNFVTKNK